MRLNELAGIEIEPSNEYFRSHYVMIDDLGKSEKCFPIRVPGSTVGGLYCDDKYVITNIEFCNDYISGIYTENINKIINKEFVGIKIENIED